MLIMRNAKIKIMFFGVLCLILAVAFYMDSSRSKNEVIEAESQITGEQTKTVLTDAREIKLLSQSQEQEDYLNYAADATRDNKITQSEYKEMAALADKVYATHATNEIKALTETKDNQ